MPPACFSAPGSGLVDKQLTPHPEDYSLSDPVLSERGVAQCKQLREVLMRDLPGRPGLVVISPMRRTLETAWLSLDWLIRGNDARPEVVIDAGWQGT